MTSGNNPVIVIMILANTNCQKLTGTKVCGPYVVTPLDWTLILEWSMARTVAKNGQK